MIKLSARVMETRNGGEIGVDYYVRAVDQGRKLFGGENTAFDAWAAYREEPVFVTPPGSTEQVALMRVERVSDAPRSTIEEAAEDMRAALRMHVDPDRLRDPARLVWGEADPS